MEAIIVNVTHLGLLGGGVTAYRADQIEEAAAAWVAQVKAGHFVVLSPRASLVGETRLQACAERAPEALQVSLF